MYIYTHVFIHSYIYICIYTYLYKYISWLNFDDVCLNFTFACISVRAHACICICVYRCGEVHQRTIKDEWDQRSGSTRALYLEIWCLMIRDATRYLVS